MSVKLSGIFYKDGSYSKLVGSWDYFKILKTLDRNKTYLMGIDQSTKCTGIFLRSEDYEDFILTEFPRGPMDKREYISEIRDFIYHITEGLTIKLIVRELPVANAYKTSYGELEKLAGQIDYIIENGEYTSKAKYGKVVNTAWKAQVVFKERSKYRGRDKYLTSKDICERFPKVGPMFKVSHSGYDAFDAVGVLEGYIYKKYGRGNEITGELSLSRMIAYIIPFDTVDDVNKVLRPEMNVNGIDVKNYNSDLTLYENIKRCTTEKWTVIDVNDLRARTALKWRIGELNKSNIALLVFKFSNISKYLLDYFSNLNLVPVDF